MKRRRGPSHRLAALTLVVAATVAVPVPASARVGRPVAPSAGSGAVAHVARRLPVTVAAVRTYVATVRRQVDPVVRYVAPVDAPVVDRFRPPSTPYGPGNRGWEYATPVGTAVRSAAAGEVVFAGQVGPAFAVTVRHDDGLRTSYSLLTSVEVDTGAVVASGEVVGRSGDRFHFGVRRGDTYLDPATLFASAGQAVALRPRLVPFAP